MTFETIQLEISGPFARIVLDRPDKLNAINAPMVAELNQALDQVEADDAARVILLSGNGRAFSAGFDLEDDGSDVREALQADFDIILRFWHSPKITIAAVHGYCLGSAMEMAVCCDLTLAAEGCRFGAPEVRFGSGIVALILPWLVGPKAAKEWLLTGDDRISAEQAAAQGLINRVVSPEALSAEAESLARTIAGNDPLAVRLTKQAINRSYEAMGLREALAQALELDVLIESTETEESRQFNKILAEQGAKAAIAWRQAQLDQQQESSA